MAQQNSSSTSGTKSQIDVSARNTYLDVSKDPSSAYYLNSNDGPGNVLVAPCFR